MTLGGEEGVLPRYEKSQHFRFQSEPPLGLVSCMLSWGRDWVTMQFLVQAPGSERICNQNS